MKTMILGMAIALSFSVSAEVLSDPVVMTDEHQQQENDGSGITSSPIKSPYDASAKADSISTSKMEEPKPLPSLTEKEISAATAPTSLRVLIIPDGKMANAVQVGQVDIKKRNEIRKDSITPIYSIKLSVISADDKEAFVNIDFSKKGSKKIKENDFETIYFMRDIITVRLDTPTQFNIGDSVILFDPR